MQVVELLGPPGVGKTTVAREVSHPRRELPPGRGGPPHGAYRAAYDVLIAGQTPRLAQHLSYTGRILAGVEWVADQPGRAAWLFEEGTVQRAILMALLHVPAETRAAYLAALPVDRLTLVACLADAATITARGEQRGRPGLEPAQAALAEQATAEAAEHLAARGAVVRVVSWTQPLEANIRALTDVVQNPWAETQIRPTTAREYCECLRAGEPFALSRWGDGEWQAILGRGTANCDGQRYTPALRDDLRAILRARPAYDLALQPFAVRQMGADMAAWLAAAGARIAWRHAELWTRASRADLLAGLFAALQARTVVMVGPARLEPVATRLAARLVPVPDRDAYEALPSIRLGLADAVRGLIAPVVLLSAGLAAKVLVHEGATGQLPAPPATTWIDCGSVWEPYVGHANRTYHAAIRATLERAA